MARQITPAGLRQWRRHRDRPRILFGGFAYLTFCLHVGRLEPTLSTDVSASIGTSTVRNGWHDSPLQSSSPSANDNLREAHTCFRTGFISLPSWPLASAFFRLSFGFYCDCGCRAASTTHGNHECRLAGHGALRHATASLGLFFLRPSRQSGRHDGGKKSRRTEAEQDQDSLLRHGWKGSLALRKRLHDR